ncbi:hypothetical protein DBB29_19480 [Pandoraea cepalis]|uniref:Transposase IS204/IS1001/IS1096/IS1165 DDE domain-containing protein n=1 Tax=Pandoraea cepalis TaxID=2508294 RepID=A0AAW7MPR3_9BURK|nr:hypothetical protein [Pandoraea cepalis]MDN4580290.1 hypothetical protein [Pandoraea cepalis]
MLCRKHEISGRPLSRPVLWVRHERSRETAFAFFEQIPEGVAQRTKVVAVNMMTAYEPEITANCTQAKFAFDLLHVIAI